MNEEKGLNWPVKTEILTPIFVLAHLTIAKTENGQERKISSVVNLIEVKNVPGREHLF